MFENIQATAAFHNSFHFLQENFMKLPVNMVKYARCKNNVESVVGKWNIGAVVRCELSMRRLVPLCNGYRFLRHVQPEIFRVGKIFCEKPGRISIPAAKIQNSGTAAAFNFSDFRNFLLREIIAVGSA